MQAISIFSIVSHIVQRYVKKNISNICNSKMQYKIILKESIKQRLFRYIGIIDACWNPTYAQL